MKKSLSLLIALILCLSLLASCGSKPAAESQAPSQPVEASETPSAEPTEEPSEGPSEAPSAEPSEVPSETPSATPTPTPAPTPKPTPSPAPTQPPASGADLAAFAQKVLGSYEFGDFLELADPADELGAQLLDNYYAGLTAITLPQCQVYINMFSLNYGEFAVIQAGSAADAASAAAILQARVDYMVESGAWYPEPTEAWTNNSRVVTNGNYVMLVVHEQADEIVSLFNALF